MKVSCLDLDFEGTYIWFSKMFMGWELNASVTNFESYILFSQTMGTPSTSPGGKAGEEESTYSHSWFG